MKQRPTGLSLSKAIVGFLQYKSAEGLSPVTVSGYDHDLKLWIEYQGDMDVAHVETTHILAYFNHLRTDYVPRRITGNNDKKLSPKTVYNLYISVASFFTWTSREFQIHNPVKGVPRPRVPECRYAQSRSVTAVFRRITDRRNHKNALDEYIKSLFPNRM